MTALPVLRQTLPSSLRHVIETHGLRIATRPARPRILGERPVPLPTLFRFLATIAILAGLVFAGMFALATFVEPTPREISVTIPPSKLQPGGR
ncbi:hypothetical protein DHODJN_03650 [Methylorubrum extorquens]